MLARKMCTSRAVTERTVTSNALPRLCKLVSGSSAKPAGSTRKPGSFTSTLRCFRGRLMNWVVTPWRSLRPQNWMSPVWTPVSSERKRTTSGVVIFFLVTR